VIAVQSELHASPGGLLVSSQSLLAELSCRKDRLRGLKACEDEAALTAFFRSDRHLSCEAHKVKDTLWHGLVSGVHPERFGLQPCAVSLLHC